MKHRGKCLGPLNVGSLPTRERGLKHSYRRFERRNTDVAPYTGAWIETNLICDYINVSIVAPYTGAWIETTGRQNRQTE